LKMATKVENLMGMSLDDIIAQERKAKEPRKAATKASAKGKAVADAAQTRAKAGRAAKVAAKRGQAGAVKSAQAAAKGAKLVRVATPGKGKVVAVKGVKGKAGKARPVPVKVKVVAGKARPAAATPAKLVNKLRHENEQLKSKLAQLQRSQQTQRRAGPAPRQAVVAVNGGRARAARPMAAAQGAYPVAMAYGNGAGYGRAASAPAGMKRAKAPNNLKITVPNDARMGPQGRRTRM